MHSQHTSRIGKGRCDCDLRLGHDCAHMCCHVDTHMLLLLVLTGERESRLRYLTDCLNWLHTSSPERQRHNYQEDLDNIAKCSVVYGEVSPDEWDLTFVSHRIAL